MDLADVSDATASPVTAATAYCLAASVCYTHCPGEPISRRFHSTCPRASPQMTDSDPAERPVLVLDFGAQYVQLIARRVREHHAFARIVRHDITAERVRELNPLAIILSGGPASVYEPGAPHCDPAIFELGVPVLGICYGMQLICEAMGVSVAGQSGAGRVRAHGMPRARPCRAALPRRAARDDRLDEPRRPDPIGRQRFHSAGGDPDLPDRGRAASPADRSSACSFIPKSRTRRMAR